MNVNTNATGYITGFINIYDTSVVTVPPPFTHVAMEPINYKVVSISLGDRLSWDGDHYLYANPHLVDMYLIKLMKMAGIDMKEIENFIIKVYNSDGEIIYPSES